MIKAAFFDIDGTLISHQDGTVPEDTREAIKRLQEKGILTFIASGRHILELEELPVRDIPFDGYVLLNGQLCMNREKEEVFSSIIPQEDIQGILPLFRERKIPIHLVEKDRLYINCVDAYTQMAMDAISSPVPEISDYYGADIYQVVVFGTEESIKTVMKQMPHCKATLWNPYSVDVVSKDAGKVPGIERFLAETGILPEEIIAFGDSENDRAMLQFAGIGVAMGNGSSDVKEIADYVTDSAADGGIWNALKHFGVL